MGGIPHDADVPGERVSDAPVDVRRPYVVGAVKIPHEQRDVAHAVLTPDDDRQFFDVIGADTPDRDVDFPVGTHTAYRVELTDEEAEQFRQASNCRYVEPDVIYHDDIGAVATPAASSMKFMGAAFARVDQFHGRDVLVGLLDGGTTAAVRGFLGATMVARQVFTVDQPGADEITSNHGCLVAPCLIPPGGRFLDAVVSENNGNRSVAASAAAARWCADQGAKIVNYSASGTAGSSTWTDALDYLRDRGVQFFASAGNGGTGTINFPAAYSTTYPNVHSSIAWDENTNTRGSFSDHASTGSGCTPGAGVLGLTPAGLPTTWNGTSASSPHKALLCAMGATAGRFTPAQVGAALKANTRDTGQPAAEQGGGAYDLEKALTALNAFTNLPAQSFRRNLSPNPSFETNTTGYAPATVRGGLTVSAAVTRASGIATPFGTSYGFVNVTGNGTTNATTPDVEVSLPTVPVTAGQAYTFSVHSRHVTTGASLEWQVQWQTAAGAAAGESRSGRLPLFQTVWARYHVTATAPAGATQASLRLLGSGFTSSAANQSWRWDGFQYEQTATLGTYFDGATAGARWEGTANNSVSAVGTAPGGGTGGTPGTPGGGTGTSLEYGPGAIIWPTSGRFPDDGAYAFMENTRPGDNRAEAVLEYPHAASVPAQQERVSLAGMDLSDWHHFAFEKTPNGVTGYLDGVQWFHFADGAITGTRKNIQDMPSGRLALLLDSFTSSSGLVPGTLEVDWVRLYTLTGQGGGQPQPDPDPDPDPGPDPDPDPDPDPGPDPDPDPGGGGTPATTMTGRLKLGRATGLTKVNLGIGFLPGQGPSGKQGQHVDFWMPELENNFTWPGYVDLQSDGAVRLTNYVGGGHTPNSVKSRTEYRELKQDGVSRHAWDSRSGVHYAWIDVVVRRACPGRPDICLVQCHAAVDDLGMIKWVNGSVISTYGDSGRPGTLATGVPIGTRMKLMMKLERVGSQTQIGYFYNDMATPKATQNYSGAAGEYWKAGLYNQSDPSYDDIGESAVIDVYGMGMWHTGDPEPVSKF